MNSPQGTSIKGQDDQSSTEMIHTTQLGVRLTTREPTNFSSRPGAPGKHLISRNVIQEQPWDLDMMTRRFSLVTNIPWLSNQGSHTILSRLRVPQDLITTGLSAAPFKNFTFWNGTCHLQFQVTGSPLTQGSVVAAFVPLTNVSMIESSLTSNFSSLTVNQCCYLFPNANTVADMEIPFNSLQAYLNIADTAAVATDNTLGFIYIVVFNQLALSASTTDNVSISIFSQFLDNQFKVPRRTTPSAVVRLKPQSKERILDTIASKIVPDDLLGDAIDAAVGIFGLDNPTDPRITEADKVVTTQYMNFGSGVEYIDKLSLDPQKVSPVTSDTFATLTDEMSFDYLKKKYSYLGSFPLTTKDGVGDTIAYWPMNPMPTRCEDGKITAAPLLSYLTAPFAFYKGGLTYKIQIVATSFQTGKIFFSFNYGEYIPSPSGSLQSATSQYGQAVEINQGSNTIEFTVPFTAITPYLYVPNSNLITASDTMGMLNVTVLNPLVAPSGTPSTIFFNVFIAAADDYEVSTLALANSLLPVTLPAPNLFKQRRQRVIIEEQYDTDDDYTVLERTTHKMKPQSSSQPLITPMSDMDMSQEQLVAPNTHTQPRQDVAQKSVFSFRDVLKKYHMFSPVVLSAAENDQQGAFTIMDITQTFFGIIPVTVPPTASSLKSPPVQSLWHWYTLLFRQFKGSLNFKIMLDDTGVVPSHGFDIFYFPPCINRTLSRSDTVANQLYNFASAPTDLNNRSALQVPYNTRLPITHLSSINRTAEFTIPYSSRFLSIIAPNGPGSENYERDSEISDLGSIVIYTDTLDKATSYKFKVFMSIGDDARFGTLYNVPGMFVNCLYKADGTYISSAAPDSYGSNAPIVNSLLKF